ncbi:hypothetical protein P0Y35_00500 [Kiritimatiellaeota bacterium B1221]|nr:hypothetical protein [Kiritimatiellaeota bacterium B1221]
MIPRMGFAQAVVVDLPRNMDGARKRNVPAVFHLPRQTAPQPLVLVSHGASGSRHGMYALAAEMAKQGYVVMCLEHVTSNTGNIRWRMRSQGLNYKQALKACGNDKAVRENRVRDVGFAIDLAEKLNRVDKRIQGRIDLSRIAIIGHSYGAYTAMVSCGVLPVTTDEDLSEPRIQLGIALSPQSANGNFFNEQSFAKVTVPFVGISGTRDLSGDAHGDFFRLMPEGDKHFLWFHDAHHFSFSDPAGGPRKNIQSDADVTHALKIIVPQLLDVYLRGEARLNEEARNALVSEALRGTVHAIEWSVK